MTHDGHALTAELLQRLFKANSTDEAESAAPRRMVGQLLTAAEAFAAERQRIEPERRAKEKLREAQAMRPGKPRTA